MQTKVKKQRVATIMARVNDRAAMREKVEEDTMQHIAKWMDKQDCTLQQLFARFNTDADEYLSDAELFEMLEAIHVPVNRQLRRIILAIFDKDRDNRVSKQEFNDRLGKYTKKAPITAADIGGDGIAQKDKEELAEMWNEEHREKAVFEDFGFDATDKDELARRENETVELIKAGKLPNEPIKGQIDFKIENCIGMPTVPGKNCCFYKLKRHYFDDQGVKQKRKDIQGFCARYARDENDPNTASIRCRIKAHDLLDQNLHACGDTMMLELYLVESMDKGLIGTPAAQKQNLSFVGEAVLRWKQCFGEKNINNWDKLEPIYLSDE